MSAAGESLLNPSTRAKPALMHAFRITSPRHVEGVQIPRPVPEPGQVLIRVEGCGLCASSLPVWEGRDWFSYPLRPGAPGHEAYGVVEAVGEKVTGLKTGERVAALSYSAFAEFDVAAGDAVVPLPRQMAELPFPGEAFGCAMNIWRRSDIRSGQTVAVVGAGFLGAVLVHLASSAGARVIALSRRAYSLEVAEFFGAEATVPLEKDHQRSIGKVRDLTGGAWCDRVIEATGAPAALEIAGEITGVRGRLIIAGFHQDGKRSIDLQLWNWRGIDVINAHERESLRYVEGIQDAVDLITAGKLPLLDLLTHFYSPDRLSRGFEDLHHRPEGFIKGVMRF